MASHEPEGRIVSAVEEDRPDDRLHCVGRHLPGDSDPLPAYALLSADGPPHDRVFRVEVRVEGRPPARGSGTTRKEAEMDAASKAISFLPDAGREAP